MLAGREEVERGVPEMDGALLKEVLERRPTDRQRALPRPDERVSEKALRLLGEEDLRQKSQRVVTSEMRNCVRSHPKAFKLLGEPRLVVSNEKVLHRLGSEMDLKNRRRQARFEQRAAAQREAARRAERKRCLEETLRALPTAEQLGLPEKDRPVPEKALRVFGDENLAAMSQRVVTPEMHKNVGPKTLRLLGDSALLGNKERQLLGSLELPVAQQPVYRWFSFFKALKL